MIISRGFLKQRFHVPVKHTYNYLSLAPRCGLSGMSGTGVYRSFADQGHGERGIAEDKAKKMDFQALKAKAIETFFYAKGIAEETLRDALKLRRYHKEKGDDLSKYTLNEIREKAQLTTDVIVKIIPYVIIIILPFSPLLMAIYIVLFPNSTPRYFLQK